jgi:excisionase family DNA binding protein
MAIRVRGDIDALMPQFRLSEAARLLGVSDDTVRRWVDAGQLTAAADAAGRKVVDGAELAAFARTTRPRCMTRRRVGARPATDSSAW